MTDDIRVQIASETRVLVVVAGPNGAGKSTFVETFLEPLDLPVVNPDVIARALSPADPGAVAYDAAGIADGVRRDLLTRGYVVILVFIGLDSSDLAVARVVQRTESGGHDVPDEKIAARYPRTFVNLREALTFVDHAFVFDNSSADEPYRFVAELRSGRVVHRGDIRPGWWAAVRARRKT